MVLELLFVLFALAVQFVDQAVYGGIHVFLYVVCVQVSSADVHGRFGLVTQFFHCQNDMNVECLVKMAIQPFDFFIDIVAQ